MSMSEYLEPASGEPFDHPELESPLYKAIETLDTTEHAYWDACENYVIKPSNRHLSYIYTAATGHVVAFHNFVTASLDSEQDEDIHSLTDQLVMTLRDKDSRRADFLNTLLGKEIIEKSQMHAIFPEEADITDPQFIQLFKSDILEFLPSKHAEFIAQDTALFLDTISHSDVARRHENIQKIKHHAGEVGKIAAGVSVALLIDRVLFRRR